MNVSLSVLYKLVPPPSGMVDPYEIPNTSPTAMLQVISSLRAAGKPFFVAVQVMGESAPRELYSVTHLCCSCPLRHLVAENIGSVHPLLE